MNHEGAGTERVDGRPTIWHLGVDAGGAGTLAVVALPDGRIAGCGQAGPVVARATGPAQAAQTVRRAAEKALRMALRETGTQPVDLARIRITGGIALAGLDTAAERTRVAEALAGWRVPRPHLFPDGEAVLQAAFGGEPGIVALSDTGSLVVGRDARGATVRLGGWGRLLGDQGSAWAVGLKGMRAAVRAWEGWGRPTAVAKAACIHAGVPTLGGLLDLPLDSAAWAGRIADFAPAVLRCADEGDPVAQDIVRETAADLAAMVAAARERLTGRVDDVALAGRLFRCERLVRETMSALRRASRACRAHASRVPPVVGALQLGALADGLEPPPAAAAAAGLEPWLKP